MPPVFATVRLNCATNIPGAPACHTFAVAFLPAFVRGLLNVQGLAYTHYVVDELPMQTLAVGCQFPFCRCMLASDSLIAFALLPMHTLCASLLDAPLVVIVVWIVGPSLTLH
jgi:hypothetical protein